MRTALCAVILLVACGPDARDPGANPGDDDGMNPGTDADLGGECGNGTELIYTIDQFGAKLSQFDPRTKTFTDLGALNCPATSGATPFSMSVDRTGTAWVLYTSGQLFKVPVTNVSACAATTWSAPSNLKVFGMGFSTDFAGGDTESLYIGGGATQTQASFTLARVEPSTMMVTPFGTSPSLPEMTGTGAGELWGFFPDATTAHVVKFDKTSAARLVDYALPALAGDMSGYAFAHWGGDYWVFLIKPGDGSTKVYQVSGMTGQIVSTTPTSGRTIVGAGVSTCAPTVVF